VRAESEGDGASTTDVLALLERGELRRAAAVLDGLAATLGGAGGGRSAELLYLRGHHQFLAGNYAAAVQSLDRARAVAGASDRLVSAASSLRTLAYRTAQATQGFIERRSVDGEILVRVAPGVDEILVADSIATLERAKQVLGRELGFVFDEPLRLEIYGSPSVLAQVSPLGEQEIETSGTVALCKYNRLMIVSPRALVYGYPWLDTLTHELTHYVISRKTRERAPLWVQEGLAKFQERRWRVAEAGAAAPLGGLTASVEQLLRKGVLEGKLLTFQQMHPSMAKLPSQEAAALAFGEVYSIIEWLHGRRGYEGIRLLLDGIARGTGAVDVLGELMGIASGQVEGAWKAWLSHRVQQRSAARQDRAAAGGMTKRVYRSSDEAGEEGALGDIEEPKARRAARLGALLAERRRPGAAVLQYDKAAAVLPPGHREVGQALARLYLELGRPEQAALVAGAVARRYPELPGPHSLLGRALGRTAQLERAVAAFRAALALNPFDPAVRCGLAEVAERSGATALATAERAVCQRLGQ
jgi:tetratricopeptide (TPR) repeat protein